jgi:hypothetical protein
MQQTNNHNHRPAEFHYRLWKPSRGVHPGAHRGRALGSGMEFRGYQGLLDQPDPRRYDARASVREALGGPRFRAYSQPASVPVTVIADLSASMAFPGKLELLAQFVAAAGFSAYRSGDAFGFIGCDALLRTDFLLPPSRSRQAPFELARRLRVLQPHNNSAAGLLAARYWLKPQPGLVFICSDFHLPLALLEKLLAGLARHRVVPVVFWQRAEFESLPRFGLADVVDPETGTRRTLLLRPRLRERIRQQFAARREQIEHCCNRWNAAPLFMIDRFDADAVTRYFYA